MVNIRQIIQEKKESFKDYRASSKEKRLRMEIVQKERERDRNAQQVKLHEQRAKLEGQTSKQNRIIAKGTPPSTARKFASGLAKVMDKGKERHKARGGDIFGGSGSSTFNMGGSGGGGNIFGGSSKVSKPKQKKRSIEIRY